MAQNYYEILEITQTATGREIKKAYRVPGTSEAGQHVMLRQRVVGLTRSYENE